MLDWSDDTILCIQKSVLRWSGSIPRSLPIYRESQGLRQSKSIGTGTEDTEIPPLTLSIHSITRRWRHVQSSARELVFYGLWLRRTVIKEYEQSLRTSSNVIWEIFLDGREIGTLYWLRSHIVVKRRQLIMPLSSVLGWSRRRRIESSQMSTLAQADIHAARQISLEKFGHGPRSEILALASFLKII